MFELFLTKIRIPNFKIQLLGRAKGKGVGGKEFLPALAFRFQFFSAAAEFRASETGAPPELFCCFLFLWRYLRNHYLLERNIFYQKYAVAILV